MKKGFTLAEVLITLGIIGIIAALTFPALIQKYKEKQTITSLKKVYSILSQAILSAEAEKGELKDLITSNNSPENAAILYNYLKDYLKVSKDCGTQEGCFTKGPIKTLDGRLYNEYDKNMNEYRIILSDGMALMFYIYQNCPENLCGNIKVDINNFKGEYTFGRDVFVFNIINNHIFPTGIQEDIMAPFEENCNRKSKSNSNGDSCTGWVIVNENMDYMHCDDLSWNGKIKCN